MMDKWRFAPTWIVIFSALLVVGLDPMARADTVTITPGQQYQTIAGWGSYVDQTDTPTLQAWSNAGLNIMRMSMPKEALVEPNNDGTQVVPLSSNVSGNLSKFNFADPTVSGFGTAAQYLSTHVNKFTLSADSWSPPNWMKGAVLSGGQPTPVAADANYNWWGAPNPAFATPWLSNQWNIYYNNVPNSANPLYNDGPSNPHFDGYTGNSIGGRLKTEDPTTLAAFGNYMATWVAGFQKQYGVAISNMSIQNESSYQNPFDSMVLNTDQNGNTDFNQYAMALQSVVSAFKANGITTQIRGPHVAAVGGAGPSNPYMTAQQIGMINAVKNASQVGNTPLINSLSSYTSNYYVGADDTSVRMLAEYWNGSNNVSPGNGATWNTYDNNANGLSGDGKQNWFVETTDGGPGWLSNTDGSSAAINVALKISNALVYSNASAYLYWKFTDGSTPDSSSLLGSSQFSDPTQSKKLDAMMQFSKFIQPGALRIGAKFSSTGNSESGGADAYDSADASNVSAYLNPDGTYVFVLINMTGSETPITVNVPVSINGTSFGAYRTSATENFSQLANTSVSGNALSIKLPADSVETLFEVAPAPEPTTGAIAWLVLSITAIRPPRRRRLVRSGHPISV